MLCCSPVVETPIFEYCGMFAGVSSNILMNMTMAVMKESVPDFFHKCPYTGIIAAYNMTVYLFMLLTIIIINLLSYR